MKRALKTPPPPLTQTIGAHPALLAVHARLYVEWCERVGLHKGPQPARAAGPAPA